MNPQEAQQAVQWPALGLIVSGVLGIVASLMLLVMAAMGTEVGPRQPGWAEGPAIGIASNVLGLVIAALVVYGGLQLKSLSSWGWALAGTILAMLPCQCGCLLGLPIGIWALIVLLKPEVKQVFPG